MTTIYVKAKCRNCLLTREECAIDKGKFIDDSGSIVIEHLKKTGHIVELQIDKSWAEYQVNKTKLILLRLFVVGKRDRKIVNNLHKLRID
jgi:hypothetical protein